MLSWKEKVAARLSRLLADTPSSPPPPHGDYSPVASEEPQTMRSICHSSFAPGLLSSNEMKRARTNIRACDRIWLREAIVSQEFASPAKSSFSSHISLRDSASCGVDASEQKSPTHLHGASSSPQSSLPGRWKVNLFAWKDENGTGSECEEMPENSKENMDHFPDRLINGSHVLNEASAPHDSDEYLSYLTEKSTFMSAGLFEFFQSCLPNIVKGCQWILLYSTWKHGISLRTLIRNSVNLPGPCLLIVGDMQGAVFGGLFDSPLKPTAQRKYQGTSQTFVFSTIYGEPRLFRATGANRFYYLCLDDVLALGGGGNFALSLDEDLLHGTSGPCETFGNLCLAYSSEFELKNVELWGFAHSSRCLT